MFENIWIFLWFLAVGLFIYTRENAFRTETVEGLDKPVQRMTPFYAILLIIPVAIMAGYRDFFYADTSAYHDKYLGYPSTFSGFIDYVQTVSKDVGFYGVSAFVKLIFPNPRTYFVLLASFQSFCLYKLFRKYSGNYLLSVFLFVASTDMHGWMFNGIRQFTAVAITVLGLHFYLTKRYVPAIVLICVASTFHLTALLLIPFLFIAQGEAWNRKTVLFLLAAMVAVAFAGQFIGVMDSALDGTQYENVVTDFQELEDDGTNPIRVAVYAIPTVLSFFCRNSIRERGGKLINFCANMSIVSTGIYMISVVTSGIFIGRLPIYFSLYGYILLPWELRHLFEQKSHKLLISLAVVFYLAFYAYSMFM